jgi:hypothetical protein
MERNRKVGTVFVTIAKDARAAGISPYYGHRLAAAGKIPSIRFGTRDHTISGSCKAVVDADLKGKE